jgi:hypothetical protein
MTLRRYVRVPEVDREREALQSISAAVARDVADQIEKVRPWLTQGMRGERPRPPPVGTTDLYVYYEGEVVMFVAATRTHVSIVKLARLGNEAEFVAAEREARERAARIP